MACFSVVILLPDILTMNYGQALTGGDIACIMQRVLMQYQNARGDKNKVKDMT
jgi:hypothetical protein